MANKNIEQFIATYGPVAQQVSKEINVDPNVLLSQWGSESRWGQTDMAKKHHNLGGIKDFSGSGFEAKDNKTGSIDKYVKFEDPEVFGMYYTDQIKRNFPGAINTGPDIGAFTRGLATGKNGSYFGVTAKEYENSLTAAQSSIPENKILPFAPVAPAAPPKQAAVPAAPLVENDQQRDARIQATIQAAMDEQEKRQAQLMGGGVGLGISGTKAVGTGAGAALQAAANRVGQGFSAGVQTNAPPVPPGGLPSGGPTSGEKWAAKTGYGKGAGTVQDVSSRFQRSIGQGPVSGRMDKLWGPALAGEHPQLTQRLIDRAKAAEAAKIPPKVSGLDWITGKFADMFRPVSSAVSTVAKYGLPPIALASAAGEGVNIAQQLRKPEDQRDPTSMLLSGANILGSGMMFTPAAPYGAALAGGSAAAQAYRNSPDAQAYVRKKIQGLADVPLLDEMTGALP
jgi:flagellar protein FlgJ